ncbi:MAG TPA: FAD-dependent oxidoreductase [Geobacterales bacterium]|nr:FAD-dependent oxidoreductase [Geobacterales bacterium]
MARTPAEFHTEQGIDARTGHEVLAIDPTARRVRVIDLATPGKEWWEPYDQLLIATGAIPFCPHVPGVDSRGIFGVCSLQSAIVLQRFLEKEQPRRAVIVGGGYIGLEMAEAFLLRGMSVTLIDRGAEVMSTLDEDMGGMVSAALEKGGVTLLRREALKAFESDSTGRLTAVVTDQRTIPADVAVLGMGVAPNTDLAQEAGITLGVRGAIRVNSLLQSEMSGIWAAGDCAESFHLVARQPVFIALGTVANRHGRVAGINLGNGYATFAGVVGTAVTKFQSTEIGRTGLQEREATALGLQFVSTIIKSRTRAGYYPEAAPISVKVLAERGSGRLLGGQIVGGLGAAKRIDTLAVALHAGMDVEGMINLDLSYAPPFSPVWDPVVIACREVAKLL